MCDAGPSLSSPPNKPHAGVGLRRRRRRWSPPGWALAGKAGFPIVHEAPPPLEQVQPRARRLDLVADDVGERRLDDLARMVRLLGRPVRERRPEAMDHGRDVAVLEDPGQLRAVELPSRRPGDTSGCRRCRASARRRGSRWTGRTAARGARRASSCEQRGRSTRRPSCPSRTTAPHAPRRNARPLHTSRDASTASTMPTRPSQIASRGRSTRGRARRRTARGRRRPGLHAEDSVGGAGPGGPRGLLLVILGPGLTVQAQSVRLHVDRTDRVGRQRRRGRQSVFMRAAGTVHTSAFVSISDHCAPRTSPERAAVTRESRRLHRQHDADASSRRLRAGAARTADERRRRTVRGRRRPGLHGGWRRPPRGGCPDPRLGQPPSAAPSGTAVSVLSTRSTLSSMLSPATAQGRAAAASRRRPSSRANRRSASQSCGLTGTGRLRSASATAGADSSAPRLSP